MSRVRGRGSALSKAVGKAAFFPETHSKRDSCAVAEGIVAQAEGKQPGGGEGRRKACRRPRNGGGDGRRWVGRRRGRWREEEAWEMGAAGLAPADPRSHCRAEEACRGRREAGQEAISLPVGTPEVTLEVVRMQTLMF